MKGMVPIHLTIYRVNILCYFWPHAQLGYSLTFLSLSFLSFVLVKYLVLLWKYPTHHHYHPQLFFWSQMKGMVKLSFFLFCYYGIDFAPIKRYHQFCSQAYLFTLFINSVCLSLCPWLSQVFGVIRTRPIHLTIFRVNILCYFWAHTQLGLSLTFFRHLVHDFQTNDWSNT